jgi:hypothetical protein
MNKSLAVHYLQLSAEHGDRDGQLGYGLCLLNGKGIPMNKSLAANYLQLLRYPIHCGDSPRDKEAVLLLRGLAAPIFGMSAGGCINYLNGEETDIEEGPSDERSDGFRRFEYHRNMDAQTPDL